MKKALLLLFGLSHLLGSAQFPFLRSLEVRPGQQRPQINCVVQDELGVLWAGSDLGLLRTDGERVDFVIRTDNARILALVPYEAGILAALDNGVLVRCSADRCDTLLNEHELAQAPIRRILSLPDHTVVLGTYGAGVWFLMNGTVQRIGVHEGLPDEHVNDLVALSDDNIIVATDQGLAVIRDGLVIEVFGEDRGAPDNLVLSVCRATNGGIWAGTDRGGVFHWTPGKPEVRALDPLWSNGAVGSLAAEKDLVWTGTADHGVVLYDLRYERASYHQHGPEAIGHGPALGLFVDREGAAWWCNGSDHLYRADPAILFVPEHEGLDLRGITAICTDIHDRIWFATPAGLFHHAAAFSEELQVTRVPISVDPRTPIVSLAASADGTVWAATFGSGVVAIAPDGTKKWYTVADGSSNDNVLAVRTRGDEVWFATLQGLTRFRNGRLQALAPEAGFVFDVLPMVDGSVLLATDGRGVLQWSGALKSMAENSPRTFYTLVQDTEGRPWAAGPGTGLCRFSNGQTHRVGEELETFKGDLFAVGNSMGRLVAFGSMGVVALDPRTGRTTDLSTRFGLEDLRAQLNVICTDASGAIWMGCDKGLVRIRPNEHHFTAQLPVVVTDVLFNGTSAGLEGAYNTSHDRNDLTVRFTALYYTDPGAVRFEYRIGTGGTVLRTRDRELTFPGLLPGNHQFQLRAFVGAPDPDLPWHSITVTVQPPWWQLKWVVALFVLVLALLVFAILRARDKRLRARDRLEKEKVRFQLDALRSQVDPHFLFNSFNTLVDLIETDGPKAVEHVEQLSDFFRNIVAVRDKDLITLGEELTLLDTYFALEQRRFGKAIELHIDVPIPDRGSRVVPLTLQLLVENALKHNVIIPDDPLIIHIAVQEGVLHIANPLRPRTTAVRSTGFGLESIIKRYAAFTDRPIELTQHGQRFIVRIPLIGATS